MGLADPPLTNIPNSLRRLAGEIERRLPSGGHCVVILDGKDGGFEVLAFGETDGALTASAVATAGVKLAELRLRR